MDEHGWMLSWNTYMTYGYRGESAALTGCTGPEEWRQFDHIVVLLYRPIPPFWSHHHPQVKAQSASRGGQNPFAQRAYLRNCNTCLMPSKSMGRSQTVTDGVFMKRRHPKKTERSEQRMLVLPYIKGLSKKISLICCLLNMHSAQPTCGSICRHILLWTCCNGDSRPSYTNQYVKLTWLFIIGKQIIVQLWNIATTASDTIVTVKITISEHHYYSYFTSQFSANPLMSQWALTVNRLTYHVVFTAGSLSSLFEPWGATWTNTLTNHHNIHLCGSDQSACTSLMGLSVVEWSSFPPSLPSKVLFQFVVNKGNQPPCVRLCSIFSASFCMFGKPSAAMAASQNSLRVRTLPWCFRWWYSISLPSSSLVAEIWVAMSWVITSLRTSLSKLYLGYTTWKNSSSYSLRTSSTEDGKAAQQRKSDEGCKYATSLSSSRQANHVAVLTKVTVALSEVVLDGGTSSFAGHNRYWLYHCILTHWGWRVLVIPFHSQVTTY